MFLILCCRPADYTCNSSNNTLNQHILCSLFVYIKYTRYTLYITTTNMTRRTRGDGDGPFRPRPVHSRAELRIRQRRHGPTSVIRTPEGNSDTSLSTVQFPPVPGCSDKL